MNFLKKALAVVLVLVFVCAAAAGCGTEKIDGTQTALTVNDEEISLGMVSFLAKYDASIIYSYYGAYLGESYFESAVDGEPEDEQSDVEVSEETTEESTDESAAGSSEETSEDAETKGKTNGDQMVLDAADEIAENVIVSQHAEEYNVSLTEEETAKINEVAAAYIDGNSKEVIKSVGASLEDIEKLLTLETIKGKVMEELAKEVDSNVTDNEAQQTSATVLTVRVDSLTQESSEDDEEAMDEESARAVIRTNLEAVLEKINAQDDPKEADIDALAKEIDEEYSAYTSTWSTNDEDQQMVSKIIFDTAKTMQDGEVYPDILTNEDESEFYILRLDAAFDETSTENQKAYIYYEREQEHYDEIVDAWKEESDIVKNEDVLSQIKITNSNIYSFKAKESEDDSAESETDSE